MTGVSYQDQMAFVAMQFSYDARVIPDFATGSSKIVMPNPYRWRVSKTISTS